MSEAATHRIALQLTLRARPTRVFQALLSPDDLRRWFCTNTQTAPHRGGAYRFWGDDSLANLYPEGEGGGLIYGLEAPTSLWYCWALGGRMTDVVFYLGPSQGGTTLQLIHQGLRPGDMLMDFWHLRLFALRAYVEGMVGPEPLSYRPRAISDVHHEVWVAATPDELFDATTSSRRVSLWMNARAQVDPRVGGLYDLGWRDEDGYMAGPQEILSLDPSQSLSYRWQMGAEAGIGRQVHLGFVEEGDGTLVTLDHVGFDPGRDNRDYSQSWLQLLWSLKAHVEEERAPICVLEGSWEL